MKVAIAMKAVATFFAFFLLCGCDTSEVQPQVIKIDNLKYEVRYGNDSSLKEVAKTICEGAFEAAPMGERTHNGTGATINVGVVRCIGEAKAESERLAP